MLKNSSALLEKLYHQYRHLMYHVAHQIINDHGLAEDAVHAAFLKLTKNKYEISEINCNKTKAFMVIIVRNTAINIYNNKKNNGCTFLEDEAFELIDHDPTPLDLVVSNDTINNIQNTLKTMNPKYSDVVTLKYFYDCSDKKIAELLSLSEGNVRVRLHRARRILISKLNSGGDIIEKTRIGQSNS